MLPIFVWMNIFLSILRFFVTFAISFFIKIFEILEFFRVFIPAWKFGKIWLKIEAVYGD
jgi:hypothetical protein